MDDGDRLIGLRGVVESVDSDARTACVRVPDDGELISAAFAWITVSRPAPPAAELTPGAEYEDEFDDNEANTCWARVGVRVHALFDDDEAWYAGRIKIDHGDGSFDIEYDDGDRKSHVPLADLRPLLSEETMGRDAVAEVAAPTAGDRGEPATMMTEAAAHAPDEEWRDGGGDSTGVLVGEWEVEILAPGIGGTHAPGPTRTCGWHGAPEPAARLPLRERSSTRTAIRILSFSANPRPRRRTWRASCRRVRHLSSQNSARWLFRRPSARPSCGCSRCNIRSPCFPTAVGIARPSGSTA